MICTGIGYYGEEEIIKKEKKTQINKKAASTTLGDIDALAALKEQLEGKK